LVEVKPVVSDVSNPGFILVISRKTFFWKYASIGPFPICFARYVCGGRNWAIVDRGQWGTRSEGVEMLAPIAHGAARMKGLNAFYCYHPGNYTLNLFLSFGTIQKRFAKIF